MNEEGPEAEVVKKYEQEVKKKETIIVSQKNLNQN